MTLEYALNRLGGSRIDGHQMGEYLSNPIGDKVNFKDLHEFIAFLEAEGELVRITAPVSWDLEITEITTRTIANAGPALLFENVTDSEYPVLINMYGTLKRMAMALGLTNLDELQDRIRSLIGMAQSGPPETILAKMRALGDLVKLASYKPKLVSSAPCQEVVLTGDDVNLLDLPILKCWPLDAGRFITLPLVITQDPETGIRNVGTYRMQVFDKNTTGMHWQTHKVGAHHERMANLRNESKLEVAVALGADPATIWTGSAPLPPSVDEFLMAGFIRSQPIELVKAKTVNIEVPAHAEFILEGYVTPGETRDEGPFGDHTGYYSLKEPYAVFHVTAITRRKSPVYPTVVVGKPVQEDYFMGKATERTFLPLIQLLLPEIRDINMPGEGIFHNLMIISIRKEFPGQAQKVMHAIWGLGLLMLTKTIIVLDDFVDIQNPSEVAWRVTANINPKTDLLITQGPVDDLDYASAGELRVGTKLGIDATHKIPGEPRSNDWPPEIDMTDDIKDLVTGKWEQYGI